MNKHTIMAHHRQVTWIVLTDPAQYSPSGPLWDSTAPIFSQFPNPSLPNALPCLKDTSLGGRAGTT
jgi:hypothetical protein